MFDTYTLSIVAFLLLALFGGHAVADYGLQSAHVAEFKVRSERNPDWFVTLGAHCLIHGFLVLVCVAVCSFVLFLVSGVNWPMALRIAFSLGTWLGWAETVIHFAIDDAKGQKRFSYRTDQILHYGCKMLWTCIVLAFLN